MKQEGIGFTGLLTLIVIGLKLAGVGVVANWSWWLVLAPLWVPVLAVAVVVAVFGLTYIAANAWKR